jgi:hypothetical protein
LSSDSPKNIKYTAERPLMLLCFIFGATFVFPVLCRISDTPKGITYRAERPPFFVFEFWSTSEYPYSAKIPSKYVRCSVDVQCFYVYIYIYTYFVLLLGCVLDAVCGFVSIFWGNVFEVFV